MGLPAVRALMGGLLASCCLALVAAAHEKEVEGGAAGGSDVEPLAECDAGAAGFFPCANVDLLSRLPTDFFGQGLANDIWGWTDPVSGREIAMLGLRFGTAFVDVSQPDAPLYLGLLPTRTQGSSWRDIKVFRDHALIVSEAANHGMQIFDLTGLASVTQPPVTFQATATYTGFGNSHNLAVNEETGMAFAVGTQTCAGGLHLVDVTRPRAPRFAGCFSADGYTHDAQCVVYRGPDREHANREVCVNSNEDTVTIVDVTTRDAPRMLSRTGYAGSAYTHQGWLSEDHRYYFLGDELDEERYGHNARTYVWDVSDLDAPFIVGYYTGARSIDHNIFVVGDHVFQANYRTGLRVLRMGDLSRAELVEVASFDTYPERDGFSFSGAWGVYPFFASGVVVVSDINRGLFVLRPDLGAVPRCSDGIDNDSDGLSDFPDDPSCETADGSSEHPRNDVAIDVKPGNAANRLNPAARGVVSVAVLGSAGFDVTAIDVATLRFGPGAAHAGRPSTRDVDVDGRADLVARFSLPDAAIERAAESVCLRWETFDAIPYAACDAIRAVPQP